MKKRVLLLFVSLLWVTVFANTYNTTDYIAKWYKGGYIKLHLQNTNGKLHGYYDFNDDPTMTYVEQPNWVDGQLKSDHKLELTQTGDQGLQTVFNGREKTGKQKGQETHGLSGRWYIQAPKKGRLLAFQEQKISPLKDVQLVTANQYEKNDTYHYTVSLSYPELTAKNNSAVTQFNQLIQDEVKKIKHEFVDTAVKGEISMQESVHNPPNFGNTLTIDYQVLYASKGIVSVRMIVGTYYNGAAHPNYYSLSFNYDLNDGELLQLSDLFVKPSNYLQTIAAYSEAELSKRILTDDVPESNKNYEKEWLATGTKPELKNYQRWNLMAGGLLITFDPYQVAAYVYGRQQVLIPYAKLQNIAMVNGVIDRISQ